MISKLALLLMIVSIVVLSCTTDRDPDALLPDANDTLATQFSPKVNEFVASGSQNVCEFGTAEDWIEIFNPSTAALEMQAGTWFISDDSTNLEKYILPQLSIPANDFILIWCDSRDTVAQEIHSNFKLSADGEIVILSHKNASDQVIIADSVVFGLQQSAESRGRMPDGTAFWTSFTQPTPGESNH